MKYCKSCKDYSPNTGCDHPQAYCILKTAIAPKNASWNFFVIDDPDFEPPHLCPYILEYRLEENEI